MREIVSILPEIIILTAASLILLVDFYLSDKRRPILLCLTSVIALLVAAGLNSYSCYVLYFDDIKTIPQMIFSGHLVFDVKLVLFKSIAYLSLLMVYIYSYGYLKKHRLISSEYYSLSLFSLLGTLVLVSSTSLLTVYLGLELTTLPLYALIAFDKKSTKSLEAAMKYFLLSVISSGIFLFGVSLAFGVSGGFTFTEVAKGLASADIVIAKLSVLFMLVGVLFKLGLVPFHFWLPDVYEGSRTPITLLVATIPKIAAVGMSLNLTTQVFVNNKDIWQSIIMYLAPISICFASIVAISQTNLKRMLGYSAISHLGFIGLAVFVSSYKLSIYYTVVYLLTTLGVFGIILASAKDNVIENINDLKGLREENYFFAFLFTVFLFSLAGIPPLAGFFAKLFILKALMAKGYIILTISILLASVIASYYYLRIIKVIYFDLPEKPFKGSTSIFIKSLLLINAVIVVFLGIMPNLLYSLLAI